MKILYDHQTFTLQKYGGISRYFYEIIKYFKKNTNNVDISLLFSNNHYISNKKDIKHFRFLPNTSFKGKQRLNMFLNKIYTINLLKKQDFDIFHPTYYDTYFLDYIGNKPFILTVYDMIHEKFKDNFPKNDKTSKNKRLLCEKATKIISISQSTKDDLIDIFDIEESKIEVVYLANSLVVNQNNIADNTLPNKYILFVGSRGIYKNFIRFIRAISEILYQDSELSVVCVGGGDFKEDEVTIFDDLEIADRVYQYNLDDAELAMFYQSAELFIFPSLYEGFGIPILEAFSCGCPLICSNTSSLSEIADNAAEYFDPYDEQSICNAIRNVLDNNKRKGELVENAKERLKYFSWEKTAKETYKIYESIVK